MVLFAVDEDKGKRQGHAVRASILAHTCLMQGLEVSFICADQGVYDCLIGGGFSRIRLTDRSALLAASETERPPLLVWDAARPLTRKEMASLHEHGTAVIEFDAPDSKSYADEVVNGFELTLRGALGQQYRLVGPDYFVVDRCFTNVKEWRRGSSFLQNSLDLLVCFDGPECEQLLRSTLEALARVPACRSIQIRAMAGVEEGRGRAIQRSFSALKNLQVYTGMNTALAAQLIRFSCFGIVSFGPPFINTMAAELPALLVNATQAEQESAEKALKGPFAGAGKTFGWASQVDWDALRAEVACLLQRPRETERMQTAARRLVDGQGAQRIARYIHTYIESRGRGHVSWVHRENPRDTIPLSW